MRPLFLCQLFYGFAKRAAYRCQHGGKRKADGQIYREHPGQRQIEPRHKPQEHQRQQDMMHQIYPVAPACQPPQCRAEPRRHLLPGGVNCPKQHALLYVVALAAGSVVGAAILSLLKKDYTAE